VNYNFCEFKCQFSCSLLNGDFRYVEFVINLLILLILQCWNMLIWTLCDFCLNWWEMMLLLWVVGEIMVIWYECCWWEFIPWVLLNVLLLCLLNFLWNGSNWRNVIL